MDLTPQDEARRLLGHQVEVTLTDEEDKVVVRGLFLAFGDGGDLVIQGDDGFLHYCWPMLQVRPRRPGH